MRKITRSDRLRYWFDNTMSRGPVALIGWLCLLSAGLVVLASLLIFITGIDPEVDGRHMGFGSLMWMSLMRALDAGNLVLAES